MLLGFEDALRGDMPDSRDGRSFELLSTAEVCKSLGMGKSWTYRRIRSGEFSSVRLGRSIKRRHGDLEEYLERHRYRPKGEG
jgi:excisionase family DNA binding protein